MQGRDGHGDGDGRPPCDAAAASAAAAPSAREEQERGARLDHRQPWGRLCGCCSRRPSPHLRFHVSNLVSPPGDAQDFEELGLWQCMWNWTSGVLTSR